MSWTWISTSCSIWLAPIGKVRCGAVRSKTCWGVRSMARISLMSISNALAGNWDKIATRLITGRSGTVISGALLAFGPEASAQLIAGFSKIGAQPDPELHFDVTDRAALLHHSAPLFTATWLIEAAGGMAASMPISSTAMATTFCSTASCSQSPKA